MTIQLDFNESSGQTMSFIIDEIILDNYIEFIHDQSDFTTGSTFINLSTNDRLAQYTIITENYLTYSGWYGYFRYDDITKTNLLEQGKLYLNDPLTKTTYSNNNDEKIIYKR